MKQIYVFHIGLFFLSIAYCKGHENIAQMFSDEACKIVEKNRGVFRKDYKGKQYIQISEKYSAGPYKAFYIGTKKYYKRIYNDSKYTYVEISGITGVCPNNRVVYKLFDFLMFTDKELKNNGAIMIQDCISKNGKDTGIIALVQGAGEIEYTLHVNKAWIFDPERNLMRLVKPSEVKCFDYCDQGECE